MTLAPHIRVGVIGCGTIAYWQHLRTLKGLARVRISALADPDAEALARAARGGHARTFRTGQELLSQVEIDAVLIATPAALHAEQIQAACAHGRHIYVEKPLAHDAASLAAVQHAAKNLDRVLTVGYNNRFHPACRQLRRALDAGAIGGIRAIESHFTEHIDPSGLPQWRRAKRDGGGVLLDLATHHLDLYRWLSRDELTGVRTVTRSRRIEEDSAWVVGATAGGVEVGGYFALGGSRSHGIAVFGTDGVVQVDLHTGDMRVLRNRRRGYGIRVGRLPRGFDSLLWLGRKRLQPSFDPSHARAVRAWIAAIAEPSGRDPDLASFEDGAAALRALFEAASESTAAFPNGPGPA